MGKVLVAFFSASGVTAKISEKLAKVIEADLFEIKPETPWIYHIWNECEADGKTVYVDALNFQGIVPEGVYKEWYQSDKKTSVALNVYYNEIFTSHNMTEKDIWAMKSRIPKPLPEENLILKR